MISRYSLFDLHCDTALKLAHKNLPLSDNEECHISLKKSEYLEKYAQIYAVFTPQSMNDDEGFRNFCNTAAYFNNELSKNINVIAPLCKNGAQIEKSILEGKRVAILALEDARILNGNIERIDILSDYGVKFVTPVWGGLSCIGGAHNTDFGLSEFGKEAVRAMAAKGMVLDLSHASEKTADDIIEAVSAVGGTAVATHSNSASVYGHTRNLRDRHFADIKTLGGLVGISLCPPHISDENSPGIDSIAKHIDRYMELGGEDVISIGADLDGTSLPDGFHSISDIYKIGQRLSELGYTDKQVSKIFFENAFRFATQKL